MIEGAHIAAAENRDVRFERGPQGGAFAIRDGRIGLCAASTTPSAACGEGRTPRHMLFRHEFEDFGRAVVAVLDGLGAAQDGAADALRSARVDGHGDAGAFGGFDRVQAAEETSGGPESPAAAVSLTSASDAIGPLGAPAF